MIKHSMSIGALVVGAASAASAQNVVIDDYTTPQFLEVSEGDGGEPARSNFIVDGSASGEGLMGGEREVSVDASPPPGSGGGMSANFGQGRGDIGTTIPPRGVENGVITDPVGSVFIIYRSFDDGEVVFPLPTDDTPRVDLSGADRLRLEVLSVTGSVDFNAGIATNTVGGGGGFLDSNFITIDQPGIYDILFADFNAFGDTDLASVLNVSTFFEFDAGESISLGGLVAAPTPGAATLLALAGLATTRRRR